MFVLWVKGCSLIGTVEAGAGTVHEILVVAVQSHKRRQACGRCGAGSEQFQHHGALGALGEITRPNRNLLAS